MRFNTGRIPGGVADSTLQEHSFTRTRKPTRRERKSDAKQRNDDKPTQLIRPINKFNANFRRAANISFSDIDARFSISAGHKLFFSRFVRLHASLDVRVHCRDGNCDDREACSSSADGFNSQSIEDANAACATSEDTFCRKERSNVHFRLGGGDRPTFTRSISHPVSFLDIFLELS